jgi:hypothetical protein
MPAPVEGHGSCEKTVLPVVALVVHPTIEPPRFQFKKAGNLSLLGRANISNPRVVE